MGFVFNCRLSRSSSNRSASCTSTAQGRTTASSTGGRLSRAIVVPGRQRERRDARRTTKDRSPFCDCDTLADESSESGTCTRSRQCHCFRKKIRNFNPVCPILFQLCVCVQFQRCLPQETGSRRRHCRGGIGHRFHCLVRSY